MSAKGDVIARIIELSGPMPNPNAHRRYLESLSQFVLADRLKTLQAQQGRVTPVMHRSKGIDFLHAVK